ncbi:12397_t:CDS:2, partial [Entrophospora sp. SA101]
TDNENQTITYDSVNDINCINYNCDGESDSSTEQPKYSVFTPNFEVLVERETSLLGSNTSSPPWSGSASMPQMLLVPSYPEMVESPSKRLLSLRTPPSNNDNINYKNYNYYNNYKRYNNYKYYTQMFEDIVHECR